MKSKDGWKKEIMNLYGKTEKKVHDSNWIELDVFRMINLDNLVEINCDEYVYANDEGKQITSYFISFVSDYLSTRLFTKSKKERDALYKEIKNKLNNK